MSGSFERYLKAKRSVDDRAMDRRLVGTLRDELAGRAAATGEPIRVLEVGAGIGTMVTRAIEWDLLPPGETEYTAVDVQSALIEHLPEYLREWARDRPASVDVADTVRVQAPDRTVSVEPVVAEAVAYADRSAAEHDLLMGAALLDLLALDGMGPLLDALAPGGLCYFPITFDGATRFRPSHPADRAVERQYHAHMDRKPGGNSRAGGDLLAGLQRTAGVSVLGVAGSDWIVRPVDGEYPGQEAFFLDHILDTIEAALDEVEAQPVAQFDAWLARRREGIASGELIYHTHQLDVLGRVEEGFTAGDW